MRWFYALAAMSAVACAPGGDKLPVQAPDRVVASFVGAIRACSAGLTPTGSIDQAAMAASGWRLVSRTTRLDGKDRILPLDAYPALRPGEYEATEWVREGSPDRIDLFRADGLAGGLQDVCDVPARTESPSDAEEVVAGIAGHFGRPADRSGERPRGGDFLMPRFDSAKLAFHWAMPRNDAYVTLGGDGYVRLEVLAMPDRTKLDQYSPDRPEARIPTQESPS